jgi:hypothetical protein
MRLSTILALVLAVALLIKRDSATSMTSTASTDLSVTIALNLKREVDSPPIGRSTNIPTEVLTATPTATIDPSAASSTSSDDDYIYFDTISTSPDHEVSYYDILACFPRNATGSPDFNAPCNQYYAIMAQCQYGPQGVDFDVVDTEAFEGWQFQSPATQRTCVCQSQMSDAVVGCMACMNAHKVPSLVGGGGDAWQSYWQTTTQHCCEVDFTPTQGFMEHFQNVQYETFRENDPDDITSTSSVVQDPLGFSTDVSVYYTMSVTRNDVYDIAVPTPDLAGKITYTTTRISDGQIVPTAQAEKEMREQDLGGASTSSIGISTSSTSSFGDSFTTSSNSRASSTRSLGIATPLTSQRPSDDQSDAADAVDALESCYPQNATGYLDFNAPCNQVMAILVQCSYGPLALEILSSPFGSREWSQPSSNLHQVSAAAERTCICQSQILDTGIGCSRCTKAHRVGLQNEDFEE